MMNDNERKEYAAELVALARENPEGVQPQDLVDLMEKRGNPTTPDDAAAILNLAAEMIYNDQQTDKENTEEAAPAVDSGDATEVACEAPEQI